MSQSTTKKVILLPVRGKTAEAFNPSAYHFYAAEGKAADIC
jgi:hypothetical protein